MASEMMLLTGADVFTPTRFIRGGTVLVADGEIQSVEPRTNSVPPGTRTIDLTGLKLAPGFIELHFQGVGGHDVWDGRPESMQAISRDLAGFGVTAFTSTSAYHPTEKFARLVELLQDESLYRDGARPIGIYLESPFVSEAKRGGIPSDRLRPPSVRELEPILAMARGKLRMMTVAPELPGILDVVEALLANGVRVAVGHTNATYDQTRDVIDAGARHATHLWNAMTPFGHREPGAAGAVLLDERVGIELILDGIHLHPATIEMSLRLKGPEKSSIITDAVKAAGMPDGDYRFGDGERIVHVRGGAPRLDDGRLAGSTLTMDRAVANMVHVVGRPELEAVRMATLSPAQALGIDDRKGRIEPGWDADLVVLDEAYSVVGTMVAGEFVYRAKGRL